MPNTRQDPPLVDLKVTNPVTYLKKWWAKIIGNEGVDVRLRIHPVTALGIAAVIGGAGFGFGRISVPEPLVRYMPFLATPAPPEVPDPWHEAAYTGILRQSGTTKRFYLETGLGQAVTLEISINVNLSKLLGKRIFATGKYNNETKILLVVESQDLEVLPATPVPLPTNSPGPMPQPTL